MHLCIHTMCILAHKTRTTYRPEKPNSKSVFMNIYIHTKMYTFMHLYIHTVCILTHS